MEATFFGRMLFGFPLICEGTKFWFLDLHFTLCSPGPNPTPRPGRPSNIDPNKNSPKSHRTSFFNSSSACFPWREKHRGGKKGLLLSATFGFSVLPDSTSNHPTSKRSSQQIFMLMKFQVFFSHPKREGMFEVFYNRKISRRSYWVLLLSRVRPNQLEVGWFITPLLQGLN